MPSSNSTVPVAWITEPATYSRLDMTFIHVIVQMESSSITCNYLVVLKELLLGYTDHDHWINISHMGGTLFT